MQGFNFDKKNHIYSVDGMMIPSVTQILREFELVNFFGNDSERNRSFGDAMHLMLHYYVTGRLNIEKLDPTLRQYLEGYKKFAEDYQVIALASELCSYSKKHMFGYTIDLVAETHNGRAIIDYKSGVIDKKTVNLQTAAYMIGYNEDKKKKDKAKIRIGLQLKPYDYKVELFTDPTDEIYFISFLQASQYKRKHNIKTKEQKS